MFSSSLVTEDDVTNYQCDHNFVTDPESSTPERWRSVYCVRQYKNYPRLYDVLYMGSLLGTGNQALSSHFALSGVTRDNALAFTRKFLALQSWDS